MPRKNRRNRDDSDDELDNKKSNSRWAVLLQNQDQEEEEQITPQKKVFEFDFSQEHRLLNQKEPPKKQEPKIVLTPEQKAELQRKLEKQRKEKEEKEKAKRERKAQKRKVVDKQKEQQQLKKEEEERAQLQLQKMTNKKKANSDSKKIILSMLAVLLFLGLLNYQKDIYARLSKFKITSVADYYQVLEISRSASESQLKNQYKKLVIKYHPDKNPNCHSCKDKFNSIMEAWQVLGNSEKKKSYDESTGYITQIPSQTLTLTPDNYKWLVADSDYIWMIQVYDSTNEACHYFASQWQQIASEYQGLVNFGRVDVWQQSNMKGYIPYKFQVFPGFYTIRNGQQNLCQFDPHRPYRTLQLCIEELLQLSSVTKITDYDQILQDFSKISVILGGSIKLSTPLKLVHSSFLRYANFYQLSSESSNTITIKGHQHKFILSGTTNKQIFKKYRNFLEGVVTQKKTGCEVLYQCKQRACLLILDDDVKVHNKVDYPLIQITDKQEFLQKINHIKNMTGLLQRFEIGYYKDGKIELGYISQIDQLNPENGEVMEFQCREQTYLAWLAEHYNNLIRMFEST